MIVKPLVAADALHTKIARGTLTKEHQMASNPRPGLGTWAARDRQAAKASYASKTATAPVSTTCGRH